MLRKCIISHIHLQNRKGYITQLDPKAPHLLLFGILDTHEPRGRPDFSSSLVLGWCLSFFFTFFMTPKGRLQPVPFYHPWIYCLSRAKLSAASRSYRGTRTCSWTIHFALMMPGRWQVHTWETETAAALRGIQGQAQYRRQYWLWRGQKTANFLPLRPHNGDRAEDSCMWVKCPSTELRSQQ